MRKEHQLHLFLLFLDVESEATAVPETTPVEATNQSSAEQATGTSLPSSATSEQNLRLDQNKFS